MNDQVYYTKPLGQSNQNNSMLWTVIFGIIAMLVLLFVVFNSSNNNDNQITPTQIPQSTQIPEEPQSTQIPQDPQSTQIPQNPQPSQGSEPSVSPTPTTEL